MNSLGIRHIKNNVRILMINNNEGAEFGFMTDKWKYKPNIHPFISAKGHYSKTKGWANDCGFDYISATSKEEFKYYETKFVSTSEQPIVFEVFTKSEEEVKAWDIFLNSNRIVKSEDKVKSFLKGILGEKTVTAIKKVVKK